jgi:hypothetical protein
MHCFVVLCPWCCFFPIAWSRTQLEEKHASRGAYHETKESQLLLQKPIPEPIPDQEFRKPDTPQRGSSLAGTPTAPHKIHVICAFKCDTLPRVSPGNLGVISLVESSAIFNH